MHGSRFRFQVPVPVSLYRCIAVSLFSSSPICLLKLNILLAELFNPLEIHILARFKQAWWKRRSAKYGVGVQRAEYGVGQKIVYFIGYWQYNFLLLYLKEHEKISRLAV